MTVVSTYKKNFLILGGTINIESASLFPGWVGNVAVTLSHLGGKSAFCGIVGDDILGNLYRKDLIENGVLPILFTVARKPTGVLLSFVSPRGQRSFIVSRGANDYLQRSHIDETFSMIQPKVVFMSGHSLTEEKMRNKLLYAAEVARRKGVKIMFDCTPHNLISTQRSIFKKFLQLAYCLCLNMEEASALTGERKIGVIVKKLKRSVKVLALKTGKNGCIVATDDGVAKIKPPTVKVVDTTGAGDCFAAAVA